MCTSQAARPELAVKVMSFVLAVLGLTVAAVVAAGLRKPCWAESTTTTDEALKMA